MTTQEQAERRAAFYTDLRGGKFLQTKNLMRATFAGETRHCCLGVGQERYQNDLGDAADSRSQGVEFRADSSGGVEHTLGVLSPGARDYYGFTSQDPRISGGYTATECNDDRSMSFPDIADSFETTYPAVATE